MFGSMIVYPLALLIGLASGLFVTAERAPRASAVAGGVAAAIGVLEFSMYFGTGPFGETVMMVGAAALACFVLAVAGCVAGAGARWIVVKTVRTFRGD